MTANIVSSVDGSEPDERPQKLYRGGRKYNVYQAQLLNRVNRPRARQKMARVLKTAVYISEGVKKRDIARILGVRPETISAYVKDIDNIDVCKCCGQPKPMAGDQRIYPPPIEKT